MLLDAGGLPQLCDFGHARICADDEPQQGIAMPVQYRAPEILLDMQWDHTVDMWSVGLLVRSSSFAFVAID
jgi:serine/threonine protein kinase